MQLQLLLGDQERVNALISERMGVHPLRPSVLFFEDLVETRTILEEELAMLSAPQRLLWHAPRVDIGGWFIHLESKSTHDRPTAGWKLHVSATLPSAAKVLRLCAQVLFETSTAFKVAASRDHLRRLNRGESPTQTGKFITIYPSTESEAVAVAERLDKLTRTYALCGPEIPSDRPLRNGSIVHYRFGAFRSEVMFGKVGQATSAMRVDGLLVEDRRSMKYVAPPRPDPFVRAGVADEYQDAPVRVLNQQYALGAIIDVSARGKVFLALDLRTRNRCIIKEARRFALVDETGWSGQDALRSECSILKQLPPTTTAPLYLNSFETEDASYLVMEDVDGPSISERIGEAHAAGLPGLPIAEIRSLLSQCIDAIGALHAVGLVHCDIKSTNVLIEASTGRIRVIDFDIATELGRSRTSIGTRGYRRREAGRVAQTRDDWYALGALLYFMITGAEPTFASDEFNLSSRSIDELRPECPPGLIRVAYHLLSTAPVIAGDLFQMLDSDDPPPRQPRSARRPEENKADALARRLIDDAVDAPGGGLCWPDSYFPQNVGSPFLMSGASGVALQLARFVASRPQSPLRSFAETVIKRAAEFFAPLGTDPSLPGGLYVGRAGIAWSLLEIERLCPRLVSRAIDIAVETADELRRETWSCHDLMSGSAGAVRLFLRCARQLNDAAWLDSSIAGAQKIVAGAGRDQRYGFHWRMPPSSGEFAEKDYLGYAHGVAGIADVLLESAIASGRSEPWLEKAVSDSYETIAAAAQPGLHDASGLYWAKTLSDPSDGMAFWCHGSAGVSLFLARCAGAKVGGDSLAGLLRGATRMASMGAAWSAPIQCHGLAGNACSLIEAARISGINELRDHARQLVELLGSWLSIEGGLATCPSENPTLVHHGYMVGMAGVLRAFCEIELDVGEGIV